MKIYIIYLVTLREGFQVGSQSHHIPRCSPLSGETQISNVPHQIQNSQICFSSYLVPHSQQVPVTWWLSGVRLEVKAELEVVGELLLRWGLVLVQEDRVMVAALKPPLVGFHPAGWVPLLQQVSTRSRFAILVERNSVDGTLHPGIADASWYVYSGKLELASRPLQISFYLCFTLETGHQRSVIQFTSALVRGRHSLAPSRWQ